MTGRLLPGIRTFISLPAGMARYPLKPFIWYTVIGTIPWTMLLVWLGFQLGEHWENLLTYDMELFIGSVVVAALAYAYYHYLRKRRSQNSQNANRSHDDK